MSVMTPAERMAWLLSRRAELETNIRDAELCLGLMKRNLAAADVIIKEITTPQPVRYVKSVDSGTGRQVGRLRRMG